MTSAECECEEDVDIYGDLPNEPCIGDTIKELEETKRVLEGEVRKLKTKLKGITTERNELESKNKCLSLNISTLYKTASTEIERKDKLIAELRKEKDNIIFRRRNKSFSEEANRRPDDSGDCQGSQDVMGQDHHPAPVPQQTESHHSAPAIAQTEPTNVDTDSCASNKSSSHMYVPPDSVLTLYSRRRMHTVPNNKVISFNKSTEDVNQEAVIPWNLIPITDIQPHKDINKEVHDNSAHLNKEYDSFSQNESKRKRSNSENCSYLPHTRSVGYAETKSDDRMHTKMRDYSVSNYKYRSLTMSRKPVPMHYHQGDEHKSYLKYKSARYFNSKNHTSRTYPRYAVSEYHSHSGRRQFYKIPRITCATSLPRAVRSLRSWSRSRSVSQSRIVPGSVQNNAERRYNSKVLSESRSSVLEIAHKPTDLPLKLADSDASTLHMKTQLSTDLRLETSNDLGCKPHMKFTHDIEPHSVTGASGVELEHSLKTAKTKPVVNIPVSPSAESKHGNVPTSLLNLSEHSSFKRSKRAKIIQLNTEIKPCEARTPDLVKNTNMELFNEHNQNGGVKRILETTEEDELHLPDSKRQVLNDITGRECYSYRENYNFTNHKQLYKDTARKQPSSGSVNESMLKNNEINKDRTDDVKNVDTTMLKERKKTEEQKEETGHQNIKVDAGQPVVDNTGFKKETGSSTGIKYDSPKLKETDINFANERMTDRYHGEHFKFRFERKPFDTKRKTSDSRRPQYSSHRYHERSRTPVTFNSQCKRHSPSELLNKDRAARRLSNQDEMVRTERSRSRSSEGTSTHREPEKYKISDSTDKNSARYLANMVTSEEQRKQNKYSKGNTKKSDSSQNYNKQGKHRVEVDGKKQNATSRQKEDCVINVDKMLLLEITSEERVMNSQLHDDCGGQTESVRIESSRSATLNEKESSGNKELQDGPCTIISTHPLNMNEITRHHISENNQNYYPTSKTNEIRSRSNNHKRGSKVLIKTDNNISSDDADLKHGPCGINKVGCEDKMRKSKEFQDKNKEMCTSNSQNNGDEKGQHSTEVEQMKVSNTKERMASGQDERCDRNCQKENLIANNTKGNVKKDDPKGQTVPDSTVNNENEKNRETEFKNTKAKQNISRSTSEEEIKKTEHNSDKKVSKKSQDYRRNKQMDGDHETEVCVSEESKVNMKQKSYYENVQQVNTLKKNEDKWVMKSAIQDICQYTKQDPKVSVSNKKQNSEFQDTLYGSPKEITAQLSVCTEANKVEKTNKTAISSRSKHRKEEERVLEEFKLYDTSDVKHKGYKSKKAASKEIQNEKQCEETEKLPNSLQKHRYRGKNEECGIQVAPVYVDNAEEGKKHKKDNSSVSRRKQSGCTGQTESTADRTEDVMVGVMNENKKSDYKDSKHVLSKQSILGFSVPDEMSNSENEKETMLRLKINEKEGVTPRVSEKYRILDTVDQKDSKYRSSKEKNHENKKNVSNVCQNYKTNKEEDQPLKYSTPQTDVSNANGNEMRKKHKSWSEPVEQKSVCNKNIGDGVTKTKAHHGDTDYAIKSAVDWVNDATPSAVHRNKISDCEEFKLVSSGHVAELPLDCNEKEKVGKKRTRRRSCENWSDIMRGLEKQTVADGTDEKHVRNKTDSTESEETNINKYSEDEDKISSASHNHENMMGKNEDCEVEVAQTDAQNIKHRGITRTENGSSENVQKIGLPESNKGHDDVEPETNNCTEAQMVSVKCMNDITLSEKGDLGYKEMKKGTCEEPISEVSVSHEVNEDSAVVISRKPSDNSANLSSASCRVSPVISLKFRARRSTGVKLEDSQAVLSVNITPPKNEIRVLIVQGVGTSTVENNSVSETQVSIEEENNIQNENVSCNNSGNTQCKKVEKVPKGNGIDASCSVIVGDNGTVDHKLKEKNIQTKQLHETRNLHEVDIKTDLNLRTMCQSVVANYCHESDNRNKEWDFDSCNSSNNSGENSDDSWCPKRKKTKKLKSQQNKSNV